MANDFDNWRQAYQRAAKEQFILAKATDFSIAEIFFSIAFVRKNISMIFSAHTLIGIASARPIFNAIHPVFGPNEGDKGQKAAQIAKKR